MSVPTQTAVIVPIAPAEAVVAHHRTRLDAAAAWGVPAHVTILFPFVPPADIDADVIARLGAVFSTTSPFDCTFAECRWFGDDVVWLAPDPAQEFRDLTSAVSAAFPGHLPYGGEHDDVIPHLTVGESRRGSIEDLRAAEADVSRRLPLTVRVDHALLMAGTDQPSSWRAVASLPFSAATS